MSRGGLSTTSAPSSSPKSTSRLRPSERPVWISTFTRNLQRQIDQETARLYPDPEERRRDVEYALPVTVGENVWIGAGAFIGPGVTVGDDSVVGAGAVVVRDVPPRVVVAGVPARIVSGLD